MSRPRPLPGQIMNSAGGYVWPADPWTRLDRFLILGSSEPTYYASARDLTRENAAGVLDAVAADGSRVVNQAVAVSRAGRAPSNDPALFALAMAMKLGDGTTRFRARLALPEVARTLAHLYRFAEAVDLFGGWGRGTRRAFQDWLTRRDVDGLVTQAIKYRRREGWSLRDVLRKVHVRGTGAGQDALFAWVCQGADVEGRGLPQLEAFVRLQAAGSVGEVVELILAHDLPREAVPPRFLTERSVWEALTHRMPTTALLRNLGKLGAVGLLSPGSPVERKVVERFTSSSALRAARVHPLSLLVGRQTYAQGHGVKGALVWKPTRAVVRALEEAFYLSFGALSPSGLRQLVALDVSGSMGCGGVAGLSGITPRVASAAMAMVGVRTEPHVTTMGFGHALVPLSLRKEDTLDQVLARVDALPMGGTDCARPMLEARKQGLAIDTFVVYTDNETWFGSVQPAAALRCYRDTTGIDATLVVVGMTANRFRIADPADRGMLDVVGFDTAAPQVIASFAGASIT